MKGEAEEQLESKNGKELTNKEKVDIIRNEQNKSNNLNAIVDKINSEVKRFTTNEKKEQLSYITYEQSLNSNLKKNEINKKSALPISDKDRYEFLKYKNYFFIENKSNIDIYFEAKNIYKETNPSLLCLLKNISLLSHVIFFHDAKEQKLLTSNDVENIINILYKNEDTYSNNDNVVYNCIIFLLEIIKLSSHTGVKNFVYYQLLRNFNKIQNLFFDNFCFNKVRHKENIFIVRKNEAVFINNYIVLDIINILNHENKVIRIYGLKLCLIFIKKVSQCNHIINLILHIIFKEINFHEFFYAFHVFIELISFLNHDVVYQIVKKIYSSIMERGSTGYYSIFRRIKSERAVEKMLNVSLQKKLDAPQWKQQEQINKMGKDYSLDFYSMIGSNRNSKKNSDTHTISNIANQIKSDTKKDTYNNIYEKKNKKNKINKLTNEKKR